MFWSGAQQPLVHCPDAVHRAAQLVPVTVDETQMAFAQHGPEMQLDPGCAQDTGQKDTGAQTAAVPSISTVQQPVLHCEPVRQLAAQMDLDGSFVL